MAEAAKPRVLVLGGEHTYYPPSMLTKGLRLNKVGIPLFFTSVKFSLEFSAQWTFLLLCTGVGFIGRNFVKYLVDDELASKVRCTFACVCLTARACGTYKHCERSVCGHHLMLSCSG